MSVVGLKVIGVRYLNAAEMEAEGWDGERPPVAVELEGGVLLYPSRDGEGNGPGVLFGTDSEGLMLLEPVEKPVTPQPPVDQL